MTATHNHRIGHGEAGIIYEQFRGCDGETVDCRRDSRNGVVTPVFRLTPVATISKTDPIDRQMSRGHCQRCGGGCDRSNFVGEYGSVQVAVVSERRCKAVGCLIRTCYITPCRACACTDLPLHRGDWSTAGNGGKARCRPCRGCHV